MSKLLVVSILLFAACGSKSNANTSPTGGPGEPLVDPTLPSWAPKTCVDYHKAVVQALDCDAIDQGKRDEIKAAYESSSTAWKAEGDASAARVDEIGTSCASTAASVRAESAGTCEAAR